MLMEMAHKYISEMSHISHLIKFIDLVGIYLAFDLLNILNNFCKYLKPPETHRNHINTTL